MGRDESHSKSLVDITTHPPLYCNEEEIEGFGLCKAEVQNFVLKSRLSLSLYVRTYYSLSLFLTTSYHIEGFNCSS